MPRSPPFPAGLIVKLKQCLFLLAQFHVLKLKAIGGDTWALKFYGGCFSVCLPASLHSFIVPVHFAKCLQPQGNPNRVTVI